MKPLYILWQRLVTAEGQTCDRCHGTQHSIESVLPKLREALRPLGMEPVLKVRAMDSATFKRSPAESNRIWIDGRSIEDWLNADVGSSTCCSACSGADCRTLEMGDETFETIPEALILKAALLAASQAISATSCGCADSTPQAPGCCATKSQ